MVIVLDEEEVAILLDALGKAKQGYLHEYTVTSDEVTKSRADACDDVERELLREGKGRAYVADGFTEKMLVVIVAGAALAGALLGVALVWR